MRHKVTEKGGYLLVTYYDPLTHSEREELRTKVRDGYLQSLNKDRIRATDYPVWLKYEQEQSQ
jgi:hypothetical protein